MNQIDNVCASLSDKLNVKFHHPLGSISLELDITFASWILLLPFQQKVSEGFPFKKGTRLSFFTVVLSFGTNGSQSIRLVSGTIYNFTLSQYGLLFSPTTFSFWLVELIQDWFLSICVCVSICFCIYCIKLFHLTMNSGLPCIDHFHLKNSLWMFLGNILWLRGSARCLLNEMILFISLGNYSDNTLFPVRKK